MGADKDINGAKAAAKLRRQAEERLNKNSPKSGISSPETETQRLLHELQVHQIELEMQNSELRLTREELEMALEKYTDLYDFAPVGYFSLNRKGEISTVNLSGARILGIERAMSLGRRFGLFLTEESRPLFAEFLGKVFANQGKESCEVTLKTEGNLPLIVQLEAIVFGPGQECHVALIDITERKLAEERIAHLASFPQLNPNPVLEVDLSGRITFFNPAAVKVMETVGMNAGEVGVFLPTDIDAIVEHWDRLHEATHYREIVINKLTFAVTIFLNPQFNTVRIYAVDITERRRAEVALQQINNDLTAANIELEAFNYSASHDLRVPLTVINSYCQMVEELCGSNLDERCRGYIREMYNGTLRMAELIETLLVFSSITRNEMRQDKVNLSKMAEEVALVLQAAAPERQVAFRIADGITVDGDAVLLQSVLDNLIGNAWKYSGNRESVVIEFGATEIEGKSACFVKDNGPGFAREHLDKLFIPFQRLPGTKVKGHGIGLATVDRIIRRHGGRVWAEVEPGKGACFYFTLAAD